MSGFTKGPWHVGGNGTIIYAADNYAVANAIVFHGHHEGQMEANARLIAAAPELLEALASCLESAKAEQIDMLCAAGAYSEAALKKAEETARWKKVMQRVEMAQAAIAKATGAS